MTPAAYLRALDRAATPGPWRIGFSEGSGSGEWDDTRCKSGAYIRPVVPFGQDEINVESVVSGSSDDWGIPQGVLKKEDASLIVALRTLLSALADVVEAVEKESFPTPGLADAYDRLTAVVAAVEGNR